MCFCKLLTLRELQATVREVSVFGGATVQAAVGRQPVCAARLENDLVGPGYELDSKVRIKLEGKKEMRERGVDSPDDGDALALTFAQTVSAPRRRKSEMSYTMPNYDGTAWMGL